MTHPVVQLKVRCIRREAPDVPEMIVAHVGDTDAGTGFVLTNRLCLPDSAQFTVWTGRRNNFCRAYALTVRIRSLTCTANERHNFRYRKYAAMNHAGQHPGRVYTWGRQAPDTSPRHKFIPLSIGHTRYLGARCLCARDAAIH